MASFQLVGLPPAPFEPLFRLSDAELGARAVRRVIADADSGYPCRVGLADATAGEELLLLPYPHQPADSPYRASGPIYVRRGARQAILPAGVVPEYVGRRLISLRAYDRAHWIVEAEVCDGGDVAATLERLLGDACVDYVHLHNAKRGCYSCLARRAG